MKKVLIRRYDILVNRNTFTIQCQGDYELPIIRPWTMLFEAETDMKLCTMLHMIVGKSAGYTYLNLVD